MQKKANFRVFKCNKSGTRFQQKRNIYAGNATKAELFLLEMQQKRNFT